MFVAGRTVGFPIAKNSGSFAGKRDPFQLSKRPGCIKSNNLLYRDDERHRAVTGMERLQS